MIRTAIIPSLILSLALTTGCDKTPDGTTPPDDGATADAGKDKKDKKNKKNKKDKDGAEGGDGDGGAADQEDPTKKVCPAETADYPAPYFQETVLIRLPKGVTEDNFVEFTPTFARTSAEVESVSCIENFPGAMISYMAMTFYQDDTAKDMKTLRDETLEVMGYQGAEISDEKLDADKRFYQAVLDVPGNDQKPDPGRALFQMTAANGMMYAIVMETHPDAWNALKETFQATATSMSFLAP